MENRPAELDKQRSPQTGHAGLDPPESTTSPAATPVGSDDDGFDASEYVRQLIARMGGSEQPTVAIPSTKPVVKEHKTGKKPGVSLPISSSLTALPLADAPASLDDLDTLNSGSNGRGQRSRSAPERSVDLEKLREAANMMTSSVLHASDCQTLVRRAYTQLAVAIVGMVTSLSLLTMCDEVRSFTYSATVALLIVSGVATYRYSAITQVLHEKLKPLR